MFFCYAAKTMPTTAGLEPIQKQFETCDIEVHAEMISIGGAIVLAICMLLTTGVIAVATFYTATSFQQMIIIFLCLGSWAYFISSITEKLCVKNKTIEFTSFFGKSKQIDLNDLEDLLLVYQGFNLERGMETIEFRRRGREPESLALGPCWQRNKLDAFIHAVELSLDIQE